MFESFSELSGAQQIFWGCAIVSSVFFLLQTASTLLGIGGDSADASGMDADTGLGETGVASEAMQMFSLRNLVNFFLGFGWGGVCLQKYFDSTTVLTLVAVGVGLLFVAIFVVLFKQMMKLEHSGNVDIERDVVGHEADVYLVIRPGHKGKVQLSVNGSVREYDAVCADADANIPTGSRVRITGRTGADTLVVAPI